MNYYVNCFEGSTMWDGEVNRIYHLVSGRSEEEIRINLAKILSENWSFFEDLEKWTRGVKFSDLSRFISNIGTDMGREGGIIEDYSIKISDVYTDVKNAVDFYNGYMEDFMKSNHSFFIFYSGESAEKFGSIMDYLGGFKKEYGLSGNVISDKNIVSNLI